MVPTVILKNDSRTTFAVSYLSSKGNLQYVTKLARVLVNVKCINQIIIMFPSPSKITIIAFEDLKKSEIKTIAIGNPKTVPAGRYAEETLRYCEIYDMIQSKLIFAENVR